jgi:hypothetical protein
LTRLLAVALLALTAPPAHAAVVWAIDDGERIPRDAAQTARFKTGADNPVWQPGQPIRLFALRDEVVAFQVVVETDTPLDDVSVELAPLAGPRGDQIAIERFVEHFFEIERASANRGGSESLGWAPGSGPPPDRYLGMQPDALIPVALAPAWSPWPMRVWPRENAPVWIDLTVPPDQPAGMFRGSVVVRAGTVPLATLPLELEVLAATMPARPVGTMLFYEDATIEKRIGDRAATTRQLWQLFHRHRVTPLHGIGDAGEVDEHVPALDGSLYTQANGYVGPAAGVGDDIIVLGPYGMFGPPSPAALARVEPIADALARRALFDRADVVLYAADEQCRSPNGSGWRAALAGSRSADARRIRVAWTCSEDPATQPVDVPMVAAQAWDTARAAAAHAAGKQTWIYNGARPATGTLFTDTEAVSLRTFGWIAAMGGIPRWFIWETTFWQDSNRGGHGPFDPFVTAETFHNNDGDAANGDGVLVYPGRQLGAFAEHSLGISGVIPSIRLKNLRRGVQDAGYYVLARGAAPDEADRIARGLFPRILGESRYGEPPAWSERGYPFFAARRALAGLIAVGADRGPRTDAGAGDGGRPGQPPRRWRLRHLVELSLVALMLLAAAVFVLRRRKRVSKRSDARR